MADAVVDSFIRHFAAIEDPNARERLLASIKLRAVNLAPESAFEPDVASLRDYLAKPIIIPPSLVWPTIAVRGEITTTLGRAGKGKEQPHSARILTPTGWTTMGDIAEGDVVVDPEGGQSTVIGRYPQGQKAVYRITFSDGATAEAGAAHLWRVTDHYQRERIVTTLELRESMGVQTPVPSDVPTADYRPLDPWVVGFLLGDGGMTQNTVRFSTIDVELVERVRSLVPTSIIRHIAGPDYALTGGCVLDAVRQLGMDVGASEKHVPPAYMDGTVQSRLEVLRGLMDADGHASGQFCSMSRQLVEDVIELARSLGGVAALHAQRPNGAWRTVVRLPMSPFWLARKAEKYVLRKVRRYIRSVELVRKDECSCIMLDSLNHLYVTDDYVVTHNTTMNINRIFAWAAGRAMFPGWTDKDGQEYLKPEKPLRTMIAENEGNAGMFHQKVGLLLHQGDLDKEERELALDNIYIHGDGGYSGMKLDNDEGVSKLRASIEACPGGPPDIVFIEPFRSLWRGEENSATDMAKVVDNIVAMATDYNCAVILSHHERKGGAGEDDKMSAARGSTVLEGVVAVMENFESVKDGDYRELTWSKARYLPPPTPVRMEWDRDTGWYKWVPQTMVDDSILAALAEADDEPLNLKQLQEATGESQYNTRQAVNKLVESKRVKRMASQSNGPGGSTGYRYRLPTGDNDSGGGLSL